jgi:hypothetical protein
MVHEREVTYGKGWDAESGQVAGPIDEESAAARDAAGEWYAVVLREPGRSHPAAVLHIGWAHHHLGLWTYDENGRRALEADLRRTRDGRLVLAFVKDWRAKADLNGRMPREPRMLELPEFGEWGRLVDEVVRVGEEAAAPRAAPGGWLAVWWSWVRSLCRRGTPNQADL